MLALGPSIALVFQISCSAHADRRDLETALEPAWEEPAMEPGEDSLWDQIEALDGQPSAPEIIEASDELAEEREAEISFMVTDAHGAISMALSWYQDPLGYLTSDPLFLNRLDPTELDIPLVLNESVKQWMRYFLGRGRKYYSRWLSRSTRYSSIIKDELARRDMPQDLFYLSMIESGFNTQAYSKAAAVGLWQFISSTGKAYDLRIDWWVDERRDPELATRAALAHLRDLHAELGDWYLAAAAYNSGLGRVRRAIESASTDDYWDLLEKGALPRETSNYVPKIIAAAIIGHHPERYGFTEIDYQPPLSHDTAAVPASTSTKSLARCAQLTEKEFTALNPALRRWAVPPTPSEYPVHVPKGTRAAFLACVETIPPSERISFQRHKVRKGESLGAIARRYGVGVTAIANMNHIRNVNRIYVGMELVIPVPGSSSAAQTSSRSTRSSSSAAVPTTPKVTYHTVARGDTLAGIASRYGVTLQQLLAWNGISNADRIQVGQRISIHGASPSTVSSSTYKVKRGDTLSGIAQRFGVSLSQLMKWNGIASASHIQTGQVLTIRTSSSAWKTYTVRRGDTLGSIASRQGCRVDQLMAWNNLSSSTIYPGQSLRIKK